MSIKSEILGIAADNGYEGTAQTITGAINALTDTLAGEDVAGGRTVASAIHALGPYIGGGSGGGVGACVRIFAMQSYMTLPAPSVTVYDGDYVLLRTPAGSSQSDVLFVPSGKRIVATLSYDISTVTSVTLTKYAPDWTPQAIDFTVEQTQQGGHTVTFTIPEISLEDGYQQDGTPFYTVTIQS